MQYSVEQIENLKYSDGIPEYGTDATGADTYATVLTTTSIKQHLYIVNTGTHPAIISLDGGTSPHFLIPGDFAGAFDGVTIAAAAAIQAKNGTPGSNYTGLYITVW